MKKLIWIDDDDLWRRVVAAAERTGRQPEDVVVYAVRHYMEHLADVLDRLPAGDLPEVEAMELALSEVRAYRSGR